MEQDILLMIQLLAHIVANDIKHTHYERVIQLAEDYRAYVTGIGLDGMMKQFVMRESPEAFEQRVQITQHIIPAVVSNITSVERKVPRSNGKTRILAFKEDDKFKKASELEDILRVYWGTMSLDDWMATRWLELNDVDPNTFVVVEWQPFDADIEAATPYPYESNATEAVMFEYVNNVLQYLIDSQGGRFTMYLKDQTIIAIQLSEKEAKRILKLIPKDDVGVAILIDEVWYFKKDDDTVYMIDIPEPHNLGRVPAFRAGYKRDEATDGDTFVSPYHDCVPFLRKSIKTNSEMDLTMAFHAFPQKIVTAKKCTGKDCNQGSVYNEGEVTQCGVCGGLGLDVHTSTQDIIYLEIPRGKEEQLSLDNMVRYITPEVALLEFQRDYIEYLTEECMQAVFNSDIFTSDDVATTATEKRIDLDNVYDTLYPLSVKFSRAWEFQVNIIAKVSGKEENLVVNMSFSKDFKFKSKDDYIADRKAALDAGTPDAILRNIDDEIMKIDTAENPHEFAIYKTVQSFDPFSGKTDAEIATAMASNTVPFDIKVLYSNMGWIFDEILMDDPEFFMLNREKQRDAVKKKVQEIVDELEGQATQRATFVEEEGENAE